MGDECEMESGLIFNQPICEFESRHPCQFIFRLPNCQLPIRELRISSSFNQSPIGNPKSTMSLWVVAQLAEHRTVTATVEGSTPFDPPKTLPIALRRGTTPPISNSQLAINNVRNCGREVRHLIVDQADDGSSPFSSANSGQKPDRQGGLDL
jgi:hypothetical protein